MFSNELILSTACAMELLVPWQAAHSDTFLTTLKSISSVERKTYNIELPEICRETVNYSFEKKIMFSHSRMISVPK